MITKKTIIAFISFGFLVSLFFIFYYKNTGNINTTINLRYTVNYKNDSWQKNKTGLLWALSYLGADLPKGCFDKSIKWIDSTTFNINFETLGFTKTALIALNSITDSIKQTAFYKNNNATDLGKFIALTIGSSWHYYAITGVPSNYTKYLESHNLKKMKTFFLTHSSVARHQRVIKYNISDSILQSVFIAEEGKLCENMSMFEAEVYEVLDVLPNGQLRFAIYNKLGNLVDASPKSYGEAGKPAKCIWCHEIVFQPLFVKTDSVKNSISPSEFKEVISNRNFHLNNYRKTLHSEIDFDKKQDHTLMELLYINYYEPSLKKLSKEWNMDEIALKKILKNNQTHTHHEFKYLIDLYTRSDIEKFSPFNSIRMPNDVREPSSFEPNLTK